MSQPESEIDETYSKPTNEKQWQEKSNRPVITHRMTKADIETHRRNLVASYGCADTDITYVFNKLVDKADDDYDDCLLIIYRLKCVRHGKPLNRDIYSIKIPIPTHLKQRAEELRAEEAARARTVLALPSNEVAPVTTTTTITTTIPTSTPISSHTSVPTAQPVTTKTTARKPAVRRVVKK